MEPIICLERTDLWLHAMSYMQILDREGEKPSHPASECRNILDTVLGFVLSFLFAHCSEDGKLRTDIFLFIRTCRDIFKIWR